MNNQIIKSIHIKNFRSYKDTFIEFHPGFNAITGAGDQGKSNIRKALDWVINNKPDGDDYISYWGDDVDVKLEIGNKTVGRFRNVIENKKTGKFKFGTENLYTLTGEKEPFRSFGRGKVPEPIKQHLNMSALNMNSQWDNFFLLDKSPPDVARHYNKLVNLEIIDRSISNIASVLKKEKTKLGIEQAQIEKKTEELKEFDWISDAEKDLSKLEKTNNYLKHLNSEWSDLAGKIKTLEGLEIQDRALTEITKHKYALMILVVKKEEIESLNTEYNDLAGAIENLELLTIQGQELKEIIKHKKTVEFLEHKKNKIDDLTTDYNELSAFIDNLKSLAKKDQELKEIINYKDEVNRLIEKANRIDEIIKNKNELQGCTDRIKYYQETEKQYKDIIKNSGRVKALLDLDTKIEKGITDDYNFLQEHIEKRLSLSQEHNKLTTEIENLQSEFKELMPEVCPILDIPCNKLKKERRRS